MPVHNFLALFVTQIVVYSGQDISFALQYFQFVILDDAVVKGHLLPQDYVKPEIRIANYYLEWNSTSHGIHHNEGTRLKLFIKDVIPYFDTIYHGAKELQIIVDKSKGMDARRFNDAFSPMIQVSTSKFPIMYTLAMKSDGATSLDRIEKIIIPRKETSGNQKEDDSMLSLSWNLGELLFDRTGAGKK